MKALIIEDEPRARNLLRTILEESCPEITTIWEAEDLPSGVKVIHANQPELVFLDVEMPGYAGTQIMEFFDESQVNFQIIFTTAYSEYAIKAFEVSAISYLLKPLRHRQVREAVEKASSLHSSQQINSQLKELSFALNTLQFGKVGLPVSDGILFVKLENIYYFKASGMYTEVVTVNHGTQIISKPLKYFVEILEHNQLFFRIHRSYFINTQYIRQLVKRDGYHLIMDNDDVVTASKEKAQGLMQMLNT